MECPYVTLLYTISVTLGVVNDSVRFIEITVNIWQAHTTLRTIINRIETASSSPHFLNKDRQDEVLGYLLEGILSKTPGERILSSTGEVHVVTAHTTKSKVPHIVLITSNETNS